MSKIAFNLRVRTHIASSKLIFRLTTKMLCLPSLIFFLSLKLILPLLIQILDQLLIWGSGNSATFLFSSLCISPIANIQALENVSDRDWVVLEECNIQMPAKLTGLHIPNCQFKGLFCFQSLFLGISLRGFV